MKKLLSFILIIATLVTTSLLFGGCIVSDEKDLYGDFYALNTDGTGDFVRWISIKEENKIFLQYGESSDEYYARYDLLGDKIELREKDGGYWGKLKYYVVIVSADELKLTFATDDGEGKETEGSVTFVRYEG